MLTDEQKAKRVGKLTASRVSVLMTGTPEQVYNLWREVVGDPEYNGDIEETWAMRLGSLTEALNLEWYGKKTLSLVMREGEHCSHPNYSWATCTLDGFDMSEDLPIECKHVHAFSKSVEIIERYLPQTHWQMFIMERDACKLSVIFGSAEPVIIHIPWQESYGAELIRRAKWFMECVENMTPPCEIEPAKVPTPREEWKTVSMDGNNEWANFALEFLESKPYAEKFDNAKQAIKEMVAEDVGYAFGYGIEAKRDKRGVVIKEMKEKK